MMRRTYLKSKIFILSWILLYCFSCSDHNSDTLFHNLSPKETGIFFSNDIVETEDFNILEYIYMYNGGGVAIGDINNDGLPDIFFTANQNENRLYLNKGNLKFEDITGHSGVGGETGDKNWTTGTTMVDINNDGWMDIYVCQVYGYKGLTGGNKLYINNQDGTFTEKAKEYGLDAKSYAQQAAFFDYDKDGDLDMFLLNHAVHTPESYKSGALRSQRNQFSGDRLYRNDGGKFIDVSEEAGIFGGAMGYGLALGIADINNDGYPDIYVSNDFHENDYLYYNQGDGTFKEDIVSSMGHTSTFSMGNDIGDINNDGWHDVITLDMKPSEEKIFKTLVTVDPYDVYQLKIGLGYHHQYPRNMLQLNQGNLFKDISSFIEVGEYYGISSTDWSWGALFADFDMDGHKDLFITNGIPHRPNDLDFIKYTSNGKQKQNGFSNLDMISSIPEGKVTNVAYKNTGFKFEDKSKEWGLDLFGVSNGVAYADLDNDGDLDLVINNLNGIASIYENTLSEKQQHNFLKIKFNGPEKNIKGIGAKVILEDSVITQMQELNPTKGWLSSMDHNLLFGLGEIKNVNKLTVIWPDGRLQQLNNIFSNQTITLDYNESEIPELDTLTDPKSRLFKEVSHISGIVFRHEENAFNDFDYEKLIPRMISREGPKIAVGDVNNDGLDDFYIGGAKNQEGHLYLQLKDQDKLFQRVESSDFFKDRASEDVGAVFIDVDNDGDLDLYVVSGGGEPHQDFTMSDRLYLNDGIGNFTKTNTHPQLGFNGSCAVKADFNNDGFPDLFIGARSIPGSYGRYTQSRILLGDGNGQLFDVTARIFGNAINLGMVTDAVWLPESLELVVVGEWMPVTILDFKTLPLVQKELANTSGWWNTIHASDLDGDGDLDLFLGNFGLNSNLNPSPQYPVNLYTKDFDNNGSIDPILSYYKEGKEYPFFGLDELAKQLVAVKKVFPTYLSYAKSTFAEVFPKEELIGAGRSQAFTFSSIYLENDNQGRFFEKKMPKALQMSPIYSFATGDFNGNGFTDVLAGGNFQANQINIGKLDASFGYYLEGNGDSGLSLKKSMDSGFSIMGEIRDIKVLDGLDGKKIILVSRNDDTMLVFLLEKK
jgi:enediyne biosynthesis protein E4